MSPGPTTVPDFEESPSTISTHDRHGFPKEGHYSLSYWLQGVQGDPLLNYRTTPELPSSADVVIIGSGMTGTLIAYHYKERWPEKSVVVLEAREFCSGATGRNAGHCKPDQWRGFTKYAEAFGTEQALKILENEKQTWSALVKYVREHNIDCDLWVGDTFDVPVTPGIASIARNTFESFKAAGGRVDHVKVTYNPAKAAEISRIKDAQACYAWPASTLHPWKLTAQIMRNNLRKGVNLQTRTKVTHVTRSSKSPENWLVRSERGEIECSQVVHATNAYSAALEPSLRGLITPSPHMCNQIIPPVAFEGSKGLEYSYGVLIPEGSVVSINPRSSTEGSILFGGRNAGQQEFEEWLQEHPERSTDDSLEGFKSVTDAVKNFAESEIIGWKAKFNNHSWSGIIALSADGVPFIGQLPGLPGQWVCAGHQGHGMARIFTAAPGLVKLMDGCSWADTQLPEVYQITTARIDRLKKLRSQDNAAHGQL
ncbi:NAD(P)/FAD-dependent oxidoreductase [Aspergillus lucknowensis]|uniref:FAD dependent oxidoreductase-domain-containing protein n=1 Tax=Aspergillus lucknowensis TaxID=176173 RepID=A0ABR4LVD0_9EURO